MEAQEMWQIQQSSSSDIAYLLVTARDSVHAVGPPEAARVDDVAYVCSRTQTICKKIDKLVWVREQVMLRIDGVEVSGFVYHVSVNPWYLIKQGNPVVHNTCS